LNFTELHSIIPQKIGLWTNNDFTNITEYPVSFNRTRDRHCIVLTRTVSLNSQLKKDIWNFKSLNGDVCDFVSTVPRILNALDGGEWSASCSVCWTSREQTPVSSSGIWLLKFWSEFLATSIIIVEDWA
jgi:hypothetical protein